VRELEDFLKKSGPRKLLRADVSAGGPFREVGDLGGREVVSSAPSEPRCFICSTVRRCDAEDSLHEAGWTLTVAL
jgi:hypothetical protein